MCVWHRNRKLVEYMKHTLDWSLKVMWCCKYIPIAMLDDRTTFIANTAVVNFLYG